MRTKRRSSPSEPSVVEHLRPGGDRHLGLQRRAELALGAQALDLPVRLGAHLADALPFLEQRRVGPGSRVAVGLGEDRGRALRAEHLPRFLGGEAEERRHPAQHRVGDVPERRLRRAPRRRLRRRRVEAVLEDVEVERAQVLRAEDLQLGDHRVELVDAVVAALEHAARRVQAADDLGLQLGGACQRPAVDLQHLGERHRVGGGVEVAGVGEQEAQRVADPPVGIDDARQDLVVDRQVAGVVGRGAPEADDLGAELGGRLAQADEVAQALAHLAARAVDREAVGQEAAVGRVALERAGDQQRRVEPAAVLVVAFEVEVGLGRGAVVVGHGRARMAAAQDVEEGRAGVEPDVEDVVALGVVLAVGAEHVRGREPRPGLDPALLDDVGGAVDQRQRVGMQLAGRLVQEQRQRHAPVALPADAPVGPVGDHVVQPGAAVLRIERGRVDRVERGLAQGLRVAGSTAKTPAVDASGSSMRTNHCAAAR